WKSRRLCIRKVEELKRIARFCRLFQAAKCAQILITEISLLKITFPAKIKIQLNDFESSGKIIKCVT
ncbi:MAG TPA: hypothetical protein DEQ14_07815, partial [Treponema sp.]|nr:hypothetical protein [Treponema sp.]